jgi:antitoxin component YwqK of YwqJK toxin-antitoxin module
MNLSRKILVIIMAFGFMSFAQIPDDLTAIRPKYAPDSIDHRNKLDDYGKKWGTWQYFSRNGMLILELNYKDNKLNGEFIRYNGITGKMLEKGAYLNDMKNGSFTKWYSNGTKRVEGSYRKGLKNGIWSYYFKNSPGIIRLNGNFKDGKKHGKWVFYDKNGTIRSIIKYEDGLIIESSQVSN